MRLVALTFLFLLLPTGIAAQEAPRDAWFPRTPHFDTPLASTREPVFALRALWTTVFRSRADPAERPPFDFEGEEGLDRELQGEAALGGTFRLWQPLQWDGGGLSLGIQAGVFGRFRLEVSGNDLVGSDWVVSLPVEVSRGAWSGRMRITHWSAHLGDEVLEKAGAERVDFTTESLDALAAYRVGRVRLYGGGGVVFRSSLENESQLGPDFSDDALLRAGADGQWLPWADGKLGIEAGVDWQSADRTDWTRALSATVGLTVVDGDRSARLRALFHDGPSPMGQFFLTDERYWGIEFMLQF